VTKQKFGVVGVVKAVFSLLAWVMAIMGIAAISFGLFTWDLGMFFSGLLSLLSSYAWGLVGSMWERLERLEQKTQHLE